MSLIQRFRHATSGSTSTSAIGITFLSRVGILAINVATGIILARTLGPSGRGTTAAIMLWPFVISGIVTLGIPVALRYTVRRKLDEAPALFSMALILCLLQGLLATAIGYLIIPHWLGHYPQSIIAFSQVMMCFAPLMTVNTVLVAFLESQGKFTEASRMAYLPPATTLAVMLILYGLRSTTVFTAPLAYELPYSLVTLVVLIRLRHNLRLPRLPLTRAKLLLNYGWRAYGLDILNTLSTQVGQVLVVGLLSPKSFGFYAVALSVSRTLLIVGSSLNTVLFPRASELDHVEAVGLVSRSARIVFAANITAGVLFIATMPVLMHVAYGSAYAADVPIARILTVEVIFSSTINTLTQAFMATGRPGLVTIFQAVGLCTTLPLMFALIPHYALAGAALALLISTMLRLCLVTLSFPVFLRLNIPSLLLTRSDLKDLLNRARLVAIRN